MNNTENFNENRLDGSRKDFQSVLDAIFCSIIIVDNVANIIYSNSSAKTLLKDMNMESEVLIELLKRKVDLIKGTGRYQVKIGESIIICNVYQYVIEDVRKGSILILHKSRNPHCIIQELDLAESMLKEINIILESSHDGIMITDKFGKVVRVNTALEHAFNTNRNDMLGKNTADLIKEGLYPESVSQKVIETRKEATVVMNIEERKLIATGAPVFDDAGNFIYVVVNLRDITELEDLRRKIEHQQMVMEGYIREINNMNNQLNENKNFIACSKEMQKILDTIGFISAVNSAILITGETGSGKEVIVNHIYHSSERKDKPIIKINCGAIPTNLFESELFGYEDGAFTGAKRKGKIGLFELANEGTLFLDEIGEVSLDAQVKLLRAIQEKEIIRIGGTNSIPVDVRILAATNQDLKKLISEGKFRQDLYYRLNVINIEIPPLRHRRDDIIPLAIHFLKIFNEKYHKKKELSMQAAKILRNMDWPGNIRELENLIENMVVLIQEDIITPYHLHERYKTNVETETQIVVNGIMPLKEAVVKVESQLIQNAQKKFVTTTDIAKALGVNQSTISRKMQLLNMR